MRSSFLGREAPCPRGTAGPEGSPCTVRSMHHGGNGHMGPPSAGQTDTTENITWVVKRLGEGKLSYFTTHSSR